MEHPEMDIIRMAAIVINRHAFSTRVAANNEAPVTVDISAVVMTIRNRTFAGLQWTCPS
jgi:hypothetical protein